MKAPPLAAVVPIAIGAAAVIGVVLIAVSPGPESKGVVVKVCRDASRADGISGRRDAKTCSAVCRVGFHRATRKTPQRP